MICLEELALSCHLTFVDLSKDEQFEPEGIGGSPAAKAPAIRDHDADGGPLTQFESGPIMNYLAERTGQLLPHERRARFETLQGLY